MAGFAPGRAAEEASGNPVSAACRRGLGEGVAGSEPGESWELNVHVAVSMTRIPTEKSFLTQDFCPYSKLQTTNYATSSHPWAGMEFH